MNGHAIQRYFSEDLFNDVKADISFLVFRRNPTGVNP